MGAIMDWLFGPEPAAAAEKLTASSVQVDGVQSPWSDTDSLASLTFANVFGTFDATTIAINRKTAMSIPAIAKARNIISTGVARLPLIAEKANRPVTPQPACLVQMQTGVTNFNTIVWVVDAMFFYGRAFLQVTERLANGQPKTFRFVPEWQAETQDGMLLKAFGKTVHAGEYIRIDAHHEGLLTYAAEIIRDIKELERTAAEVGANPTPSVILKQKAGAPLTGVEKTELMGAWSTARRKRFGSVGFLGANVDAEVVGQAAENLLIEGRNFAVLQAARMCGVPSYFLDGAVSGASLTYTNVAGKNRQLTDEALAPYMIAIEQTLSMHFPAGTVAEFDTSAFLRGDIKERFEVYKLGIDAGIYTKEEVRSWENLDALPDDVNPSA